MKKIFCFITLLFSLCAIVLCVGCGSDLKVSSITVNGMKTEFAYGEDFSLSEDAKVVLIYSNNDKKDAKLEDFVVDSSTFDNKTPGRYKIIVRYKNDNTIKYNYYVTVKEREILSISLDNNEKVQESYFVGDKTMDISSGKIIVQYIDGGIEEIPLSSSQVELVGFNSQVANDNLVITVRYRGKETAFNIKILNIVPINVTFIEGKTPSKTKYYTSDEIVVLDDNVEVEVEFNNGTKSLYKSSYLSLEYDQELLKTSGEDKSVYVTFSKNGKTAKVEYKINVYDVLPVSMKIAQLPNTNYFTSSKALNLNGLGVEITYNDGRTAIFDKNYVTLDENIEDTLFNEAGDKDITIYYSAKGITINTTLQIKVVDVEFENIEIENLPTKTTYYTSDTEINFTGMKINALYNDDSIKDITAQVIAVFEEEISVDFSVANENVPLVLKYTENGKTISKCIFIEILDVLVDSISIDQDNLPKTRYYVGDDLDLSIGRLIVSYNDGTKAYMNLNNKNISILGFDSSCDTESQEIIINYAERSCSFEVEIVKVIPLEILVFKKPNKTIYYTSDTKLDLEGLQVQVVRNNGTYEILGANKYTISIDENFFTTSGNKVITIKYMENNVKVSVGLEVEVKEVEISSIDIDSENLPKQNYYVGDGIDLTIGKIIVSYNNGKKEVLALNDSNIIISGFNSTSPVDSQNITVEYNGKYCYFVIDIADIVPIKIEITTNPTKLTYYTSDDSLDIAGLIVKATFNNNSFNLNVVDDINIETLSDDFFKTIGEKSVNISYTNNKTTVYTYFVVTIIEVVPVSISMSESEEVKTVYYVDDEIDLSTGKILVLYNDGSTKEVALNDANVSVSGFDSSNELEFQTLTVSYNKLNCNFNITIIKKDSTGESGKEEECKHESYTMEVTESQEIVRKCSNTACEFQETVVESSEYSYIKYLNTSFYTFDNGIYTFNSIIPSSSNMITYAIINGNEKVSASYVSELGIIVEYDKVIEDATFCIIELFDSNDKIVEFCMETNPSKTYKYIKI